MPRPVLTSEQRRATRRLIQKAAADLYAKDGGKGVSVRSIADSAGVSVGTIYANFANLTELMQSLWKQPAQRLFTELAQAVDKIDDPLEKLKVLLQTYANFATEQRAVYRGAFLYVRPESGEQPKAVALKDDRFFSLLRQAIIEGQADKIFITGDPDQLAQTLWSAVHGAIALPINIDRLAFDTSEKPVHFMIEAMLSWLQQK